MKYHTKSFPTSLLVVACFLANMAFAAPAEPANDLQSVVTQLQQQMKDMHDAEQKQIQAMYKQLKDEIKTVEATLQNEINTVDKTTQEQIKKAIFDLQGEIKQAQLEEAKKK